MSSHNAKTHYIIHPKKSNSYQSGLSKLCLTVMQGEHNALPSPSRAYQAPLLTVTTLTCPHLTMSLHLHAPCHLLHKSCQCCCAPYNCTHHIAVPLMAAHIALLCPSQLHALCCHPPCGCTHCVTMPCYVLSGTQGGLT